MAAFSWFWLTMWLGLWMPGYVTRIAEMKLGYSVLKTGMVLASITIFMPLPG
ncbi:hypothetical protein AB1K18_11465 [Peribacillus simplex]|uniref:hypothetical protein n=1 Tax=Peribacillus TaxID=2675229 RepID=UPI0025A2CD09|nr:hypothetical protein [Peribacillus sp. NJ4]